MSNAMWSEMRDASLAVIMLANRSDGFLGIPTSEKDRREKYENGNVPEVFSRSEREFGHASITVSFNGLLGIRAALGRVPSGILRNALSGLATHRARNGGYGNPNPRLHGEDWHTVPRHTAMALLTRLEFDRSTPTNTLLAELTDTANCLLAMRRKGGGWEYNWSSSQGELEFMSTACAVGSLALFAVRLKEAEAVQHHKIRAAVSGGLNALKLTQTRGGWQGETVPPENEYRDSAFSLRVLQLARAAQPEARYSAFNRSIDDLIRGFTDASVLGGWPAGIGQSEVDLATTIEGAALMASVTRGKMRFAQRREMAESNILDRWEAREGWKDLTCWDWQSLAFLSGTLAGPLCDSGYAKLEQQLVSVKRKTNRLELTPADLGSFHQNIQAPLEYCLSQGSGLTLRTDKRSHWKAPDVASRHRKSDSHLFSRIASSFPIRLASAFVALLGLYAAFIPESVKENIWNSLKAAFCSTWLSPLLNCASNTSSLVG